MVMQNNQHVKHTDTQTNRNITDNINPKHKQCKRLHTNAHTRGKNTKPHLNQDNQTKPRPDVKTQTSSSFTRKERNHVLLSTLRISKTAAVYDPTGNNVAPGYKNPNQKKRISALQSQGVKDLLIEKVYVIMLFSI